jgi:aminoglycoside phosphotransferase (APT) family kinase protein
MAKAKFLSNLNFMARSPLILAALAKAAVPHLNFVDVKGLTSGTNGAFDTALLTATTGEHYVVRIANTQTAGAEQDVELRALKALSKVDRMRLPFKLTNLVGEAKDEKGARALVFEFIYGNQTDITTVGADTTLSSNIAKAIAAIHNLDTSIVENAHLASFEPAEIVRGRVAELDRFAATGKVPSVLLSRWEQALEDTSLFRFKPTVIHGGLNGETMLTLDDQVSGVLSWSTLRVSDPAEDFAWILGSGIHELSESIIDSYRLSHSQVDDALRLRATLYSEFEFARWLMFGIGKKNAEIIDEAVLMLQGLAEDVSTGAVGKLVAKPATPIAATELIDKTPVYATQVVEEITVVETFTPVDDVATRPIDLPTKPDNELF